MVLRVTTRTKTAAKVVAARARNRGFNASVFEKKGRMFGVSVTRRK